MSMQTHAHTALLQAEEVAREQAAQSLKALQGEFEEAKVRGHPTFCVASDGLGQCQRGPKRAPASAGPTGAASSLLATPFLPNDMHLAAAHSPRQAQLDRIKAAAHRSFRPAYLHPASDACSPIHLSPRLCRPSLTRSRQPSPRPPAPRRRPPPPLLPRLPPRLPRSLRQRPSRLPLSPPSPLPSLPRLLRPLSLLSPLPRLLSPPSLLRRSLLPPRQRPRLRRLSRQLLTTGTATRRRQLRRQMSRSL